MASSIGTSALGLRRMGRLLAYICCLSRRWFARPLVRWSAGPLGRWFAGPLVGWFAGPLVRWFAGPLVRWAAGPLGRSRAGVQRHRHRTSGPAASLFQLLQPHQPAFERLHDRLGAVVDVQFREE